MTNEMIRKYAEAAAEWWGEDLRYPKFDNGDESERGALVLMLANMTREIISEDVISEFKSALFSLIEKELQETERATLSVDYNVDSQILYEALKAAGISNIDNKLSWKTTMSIGKNGISYSHGYGADYEVLTVELEDKQGR